MTVAAYTVVPALGIGAAIVSLNGNPSVRASAGQGAIYTPIVVDGFAVAPINFPITNYLPMVRIPSNAIIKSVELLCDTYPSTSLTLSVGLAFSNGGAGAVTGATTPGPGFSDGTSSANLSTYSTNTLTYTTGTSIISYSCFALNYALSTALPLGGKADVTFLNGLAGGNSVTDGFYVPSASQKPIWQALSAGGIGGLGKATTGAQSATVGSAFTLLQTDPGGFFDIVIGSNTVGVNTAAVNLGIRVTYALPAQ